MSDSLPVWIFIAVWAVAFALWPIKPKAKIWFFLVSLLVLALWKWVFLRFWPYHWMFITVAAVLYFGAAALYTSRVKINHNSTSENNDLM